MPVWFFNSDLKLDSWDSSACSLKCSCRTLASDIIEEHFAGFALCWHALTVGTHNSKTQRCNTSFLHFKSLHEVQFCTDSVDYINFEWTNKSDYIFLSLAFIIFKAASNNFFQMGDSFAIHSELFTIILTVSGILLLFKQLYFEYWSRRDFSVCILFKSMFVCSWEQISVHTCKWTLVQVNLMGRFYILFLIYFTPNLGFFEWIIQHPLSNKGSNPTMRNRTQTSTFFAPKSRYFLAHVHLYPIDFVLHLRLCKQKTWKGSHMRPLSSVTIATLVPPHWVQMEIKTNLSFFADISASALAKPTLQLSYG